MLEKGKEMFPVGKGLFCPGVNQGVFTVEKDLAEIANSFLTRQGLFPQLLSGTAGSFKGIPTGENGPGIFQDISGEAVGMGTGTAIFQSLQLTDKMRPAKLAGPTFLVGVVG